MADAPGDRHYPCSQCGADLRFAPGQSRLECAHCGHAEEIAPDPDARRARALGELDLEQALASNLPETLMEETRVAACASCGAQVEFRAQEHARECPYCASPIVGETGAHRHIKPQALIPFTVTETEAQAAMTRWLGGLWFAPNGLQAYARKGRRLAGVYAPYWTLDGATQTRYRGERGTRHTVRRGKETRVEIRWAPVSGRVARLFDDVAVIASHSLPRHHADGLQPWDFSGLRAYHPDYLAGFRAEGYSVTLVEGHEIAREMMKDWIEADVRRDIGGDAQRISALDTDWRDETFKHVLLPIWMAAYRYGGKSYRFVVNGQTGKVRGERPWSVWKIAFAVLLAAIVVGAFAVLSNR
jgi:DNA-directed RNA polymerase subunit RPC12/RpoP